MKQWLCRHSIILSLILLLLIMGLIFWFSAQPGDESGQLSGGITAWLLGLLVPELNSLSPDRQAQLLADVGLFIRKLGHFSEFALLGAAWLIHLRQVTRRIPLRRPWLLAWLLGTAYAVTDECHQIFVPGRGPAVWDVCIDSAGAAAGAALLWLISQIHTCKTQKRKL